MHGWCMSDTWVIHEWYMGDTWGDIWVIRGWYMDDTSVIHNTAVKRLHFRWRGLCSHLALSTSDKWTIRCPQAVRTTRRLHPGVISPFKWTHDDVIQIIITRSIVVSCAVRGRLTDFVQILLKIVNFNCIFLGIYYDYICIWTCIWKAATTAS